MLSTTRMTLACLALALFTNGAVAAPEEHVTGGNLDLVWTPGFGVPNNLQALTLAPSDAGYANPSGDHTVGLLVTAAPEVGGIALAGTDPGVQDDYAWEGWVFTGDGSSRRGLVVRADQTTGFTSCYQFVVQAGLLQLSFRKLVASTPTTLASWFTTSTPGGLPTTNSWHHMKIQAAGSSFRCFWDGFELTTTPIEDTALTTGWVGVYNFRFDVGGIPLLVDDLILTPFVVSTQATTWSTVKGIYAASPVSAASRTLRP